MSKKDYIFGFHAVHALLKTEPELIDCLFIQRKNLDQRQQLIINLAKHYGVIIQEKSRPELDDLIAPYRTHQGLVALTKASNGLSEIALHHIVKEQSDAPLLLILDGIQDPHNLGACLRSADALGVNAVIVPKDRAAQLTPIVRKVASGAASTVPFISVTNLVRTMRWLKDQGVWLVGTAIAKDLPLLNTIDLTGPIALVLGGEEKGLRQLTQKSCDYLAMLPMLGTVESLNVSVMTGIALYEVQRQRKFATI